MAGNLNVTWIHGSANCATTTDPPIQVHHYDADTVILRQSKCSEPGTPPGSGPSFEAPFLYLLFGGTRALLLDSGASHSAAVFPLAATIKQLLADRAAAQGKPPLPLWVAHSHSHGDHVAGDPQLHALPNTTIAPLHVAGVKSFFGIANWPADTATFDLGGRVLEILPIPGHEQSHIAVYDRQTQLLLTGDTLYPGLLVVEDWDAYRHSAERLAGFAATHPLTWVLGAHIEMTHAPRHWFGLGTLFQPNEHVLQLTASHLTEWNLALRAIGPVPRTERHDDFIIYPAGLPLPAVP